MSHALKLPDIFVHNVLGVCGTDGAAWLDELPRLVSQLERQWNITVGGNFPDLSYNFVAPAILNGGGLAVLKLVLPAVDCEFYGEAAYLRCNGGNGVVKLFREDGPNRALLLERAVPGIDLKKRFSAHPETAVGVAVHLLKQVTREPSASIDSFVRLQDWTRKLADAALYDFPERAAAHALDIFERCETSASFLLHGDFHHTNILSSKERSFLVIDPKGVIGDLKYDIAVFLNNHRAWLGERRDLQHQLELAVARFADEFGFSAADILDWAYAQKVLGSLWTLMDGGDRWREQLASSDIWDV